MTERILADLARLGPELALTGTFLVALLVDLIFPRRTALAAGTVMAGFALSFALVLDQSGVSASIFSGMLTVDPFAMFFKLVIVGSALLVTVFSLWSSELNRPAGRPLGEYYALLAAMTLGMVLMTGAGNLLMMYLAIELSSLSSYLLTGYTREQQDSSEASLKYVIFGATASGMMLYGMSILYGLTGTLDVAGLNAVLARGDVSLYALAVSGALILVGFGYKISAVPFHFWTPDVYQGAPITITAFLSVASKAAGFALLLRFVRTATVGGAVPAAAGTWALLPNMDWREAVAILAVLTMTVGNLIAVWQDNLKRLLAYSSIAHAGYMLAAVVVLGNDGVAAILIYFVVYLIMNLGAFYCVMLIANATGSEDIEEYRGLGARAPLLTVGLSVFLVSLVGLPPTAGFIGKLYLFSALLTHTWYWLALAVALNSVISLYYYMRVVRNMYLRDGEKEAAPIVIGAAQTAVLLLLLVPTILLGLYFSPLVDLAQASVRMLSAP